MFSFLREADKPDRSPSSLSMQRIVAEEDIKTVVHAAAELKGK